MNGILEGIRVVDLTRILAGPYATRLLADFGAEVIKVQTGCMAAEGESVTTPQFRTWNRNKRSVTLNLNAPEARELFLRVVAVSDVVVENFAPRVMSNWGLTYDALQKINSQLVMLSLTGFGQSGPWKDMVAFGPTVQSLGGLTFLTASSKEAPIGLGNAYADQISGIYGAIAILGALEQRDRTGEGLFIDLSEYEALCTTLGPALMTAALHRHSVEPQGNAAGALQAAPHGCFQCRGQDRWCVLAVFNEKEWQALCRIMEQPDLAEHPCFCSLSRRMMHLDELHDRIAVWTRGHQAEDIVASMQRAGVPAGLVQSPQDLLQDPHLRARKFIQALPHPDLGLMQADRPPFLMQNSPPISWNPSPLLGEANHYLFCDVLGLSEEDLEKAIEAGWIA